MSTTPSAEQSAVRLQRALAIATLALVGSTWRLWTPGTQFPEIPWFAWACGIPPLVDRAALTGLGGSCLLLLLTGPQSRWRTAAAWLFAGSLIVLVLPSQQRLQPWAYEFLLIAVTFGLAPLARALRLLRWLIASIYIFSALSKVDVAFFDAQGEMLLDGLLGAIHLSDEFWSEGTRQFVIGLFPAGELVVGVGLLIPAVRRWALIGSYVMHALLLLTLGPWGLDHRHGVLIWNLYFIGQNWLLFRPIRPLDAAGADNAVATNSRLQSGLATGVVAAAIGCPILQSWGWYDVWPSWAVYSSRPSQVNFTVAANRVGELPPGLQKFAGPAEPLTEWRPVNLDAWSFAALNCPVYPEERFRIAVIRAVVDGSDLDDGVRVVVHGPPARWTGRRETTEIIGRDALSEYSTRYRLNTMPREE